MHSSQDSPWLAWSCFRFKGAEWLGEALLAREACSGERSWLSVTHEQMAPSRSRGEKLLL